MYAFRDQVLRRRHELSVFLDLPRGQPVGGDKTVSPWDLHLREQCSVSTFSKMNSKISRIVARTQRRHWIPRQWQTQGIYILRLHLRKNVLFRFGMKREEAEKCVWCWARNKHRCGSNGYICKFRENSKGKFEIFSIFN